MRPHVRQLRSRRCFKVIELAFYRACARFGGRICQFSMQHNHLHIVAETLDRTALAKAMHGMCIRNQIAKGLNRVTDGRHGATAPASRPAPFAIPQDTNRSAPSSPTPSEASAEMRGNTLC